MQNTSKLKMIVKAKQTKSTTKDNIVLTYLEYNQLKNLYRQGWLKKQIPINKCESVAEHSFGVALLSLFIASQYFPELDTSKVVTMALLHEFGEIYAGDITPHDKIDHNKKALLERNSVEKVLLKLRNGRTYTRIWEEYERGESNEAVFVKQMDLLEMGMQAQVYAASGYKNMENFIEYTQKRLNNPKLQKILTNINKSIKKN